MSKSVYEVWTETLHFPSKKTTWAKIGQYPNLPLASSAGNRILLKTNEKMDQTLRIGARIWDKHGYYEDPLFSEIYRGTG